jgi:hypothetical protein
LVSVTVYPSGVGESSPLSNTLWGFANLAVGFVFLWFIRPQGSKAAVGWILESMAFLLADVWLSSHFGSVRSQDGGNFMHDSGLGFIRSIHGEWVLD